MRGQAAKLDGFHCAAAEVRHAYKHKHMRTAFSQLPLPKDPTAAVSSKARALLCLPCSFCLHNEIDSCYF